MKPCKHIAVAASTADMQGLCGKCGEVFDLRCRALSRYERISSDNDPWDPPSDNRSFSFASGASPVNFPITIASTGSNVSDE